MTQIKNGLMACKFWFAFFEKGVDAFVTVVRIKATQLCFGFVAQHLFELGRLAHVDRVLCSGECDWRRRAQSFCELQCRCFQIFRRYDLIDDA